MRPRRYLEFDRVCVGPLRSFMTAVHLSLSKLNGGDKRRALWALGCFIAWQYLNGLQTPPAADISSAQLIFITRRLRGGIILRFKLTTDRDKPWRRARTFHTF